MQIDVPWALSQVFQRFIDLETKTYFISPVTWWFFLKKLDTYFEEPATVTVELCDVKEQSFYPIHLQV